MAIPFLNNINLSDNQLLNAKLQVTGTAPTASAGQIYFNSTESVAKYHDGTTWVDIPRKISVGGTPLAYSQAIDLVAGTNVGIAESSGTITISSSDQFTGTVTSVSSSTAGDALDVTVTNATTTPNLAFTWSGNPASYVRGDGTLATFPTIPTVPSNIVETIVTTSGTFIDLTPATAVDGNVTITADLSASGTANATTYLRGDNTWSLISDIPGTYTFNVTADGGTPQTIGSSDVLDIAGGIYITTSVGATDTVTINHDSTTRSDTTSADAPGYGGTFNAVTSVTTNATGHVTAIDLSTVTIPASDNTNDFLTGLSFNTGDGVLTATVQNQTDVTVDLDGRYLTGNQTITLTGEVTGSGTTSISTTVANNVLDINNFTAATIVTEAEGIENNDNDVTLPTSAAVKAYADSLIVGGLVYQGGYNAATNIPDLTTSPNNIKKGWTYTVTGDGTFFGEQLRSGDVLIAEIDSPLALVDWTTVQNNIDLASLTQIGIGNVNEAGAGNKDGLSVSYASGTATVGLNITDLPNLSVAITAADLDGLEIPIYNGDTSSANEKIEVSALLSAASRKISYATTITDTATISHGLASSDVMVQLYDITTGETVYADVDRISTTQVTITFATTPTNSVRVLVQKIG